MNRSDYLDPLIVRFKMLRQDKNATFFLDVMCDGFIWSDEKIQGLNVNEMACLRGIFRYRTSLIVQEADKRFESLWNELKAKYPDWIGFEPSRCSPSEELNARYREAKKKPLI